MRSYVFFIIIFLIRLADTLQAEHLVSFKYK
jgi:hypothetical protein